MSGTTHTLLETIQRMISSDYSYSLNFDDDDLMLNLFQITEILSYLKSESFKVYKNKELTSISVSDLNKPMAVFIF